MAESPKLQSAREHLARAEARLRSEDGLFHLEEGLALLEELIDSDGSEHRIVAQNLASTYSTKIYRRVKQLVSGDRALPEPELEHLFKVVLAFDAGGFTLPDDARALKIDVVRRLIDLYYEGHPAAAKRKALQRLEEISGGGGQD